MGVVLLGGFLLRVFYGPVLGLPERGPGQGFVVDEHEYYSAASMLADGRGFSFYDTFAWTRAPLYVVFLAAVFRLAGKTLELVYLLQALMSAGTVYLLAQLAGRVAQRGNLVSGRAATLAVACLGSFWLSFTLFSELLLSETLFLLLFAGAIALLALHFDRAGAARPGLARWLPIFGAGVLLGLSALTRSTALAFVPLVALLVAWVQPPAAPPSPRRGEGRGEGPAVRSTPTDVSVPALSSHVEAPRGWPPAGLRRHWAGLAAALLLLAGVALVGAPWTLRNYAAYGRFVFVDTSAGYNLWLASTGVRDAGRLATALQSIEGPVEKQDFAYRQAFDNIAADPAAFLGKGLKESLDLWTINPTAEERRVGGFSQGRVPAAHLLSLFVLEDLLYVAIVGLAVAGLLASPPDPLRWAAVLWVLLWVAMAFVFFAVNRFRFPMIASLLPWVPLGAASMLATLRSVLRREQAGWRRAAMAAFVPVLLSLPLLPALPVELTRLGTSRWYSQRPYREAERQIGAGNFAAARSAYLLANQELSDTRYGLAAADIALAGAGAADYSVALRDIAARAELAADLGAPGSARFEPFLLRGAIELLLGQPGTARTLLGARPVDDNSFAAMDWADRHLLLSGGNTIDVGSDVDPPFLTGFYAAERYAGGDYRWTGSAATIELRPGPPEALLMRWSGWRPEGLEVATVEVWWRACGGSHLAPVQRCPWQRAGDVVLSASDTWQETRLIVPGATELRLEVNGFVPGGFDPRELGVRIDSVRYDPPVPDPIP